MRTVFILLFVFFSVNILAQKTTWYDNNWKEVKQTEAVFYVPMPKKVKNGYWIVKFYKNGNRYLEGYSSNSKINNELFEGIVNYYDINGTLSKKVSYKNGIINGPKRTYFKTGELQSLGRFKNGKENGVWKTFYKNGKIKTRGKYKNGEKVGVWKTFYKNVY